MRLTDEILEGAFFMVINIRGIYPYLYYFIPYARITFS